MMIEREDDTTGNGGCRSQRNLLIPETKGQFLSRVGENGAEGRQGMRMYDSITYECIFLGGG